MHVGHGTFNWQELANQYQQRQQGEGRARIMNSGGGGWQSEAVRTAFNLDRRPERDHRTTAAVNDAKKLFPSKLKDLGAYPWVIGYDSHSCPVPACCAFTGPSRMPAARQQSSSGSSGQGLLAQR